MRVTGTIVQLKVRGKIIGILSEGPWNIILTLITGGVRITWTPCIGAETEIWVSIDGADYILVATLGLTIGTYDYMHDEGVDLSFKLRCKYDHTILNAPLNLTATDLGEGVVQVTWDDNNTEAEYIEIWADIESAGFVLITTLAVGIETYNHTSMGGNNVIYKVRAKEGTLPVYSDYSNTDEIDVAPAGIFDADGNEYHEVTIGTQIWLLENLKTTKYNDLTSIPTGLDNSAWDAEDGTPGHDGAFAQVNNNAGNKTDYGLLYNWYAATNSKGIAPSGYRVPSQDDFNILKVFLGNDLNTMGNEIRETGTTHWTGNAGATNTSGFTAVGAGARYNTGGYGLFKTYGIFWLSNNVSAPNGARFHTNSSNDIVDNLSVVKDGGCSVRCIKI